MDPREEILRSLEDEEISLDIFSFDDRYYGESWDFDYKYQNQKIPLHVSFTEYDKRITLSYREINIQKEKDKRLVLSKILEKLKKKIETSTKYRLLILFEGWKVKYQGMYRNYLIHDTEHFENRKTKEFVEKNKAKYTEIVNECFEIASKDNSKKEELLLVIKEEDELPLYEFLIDQNIMTYVTTLDDEEIIKLKTKKQINQEIFYPNFVKKMRVFGYNLYFDKDLSRRDLYEDDEYYWYDDYYDYPYNDEDAPSLVRKKIRDQNEKKITKRKREDKQ